KEDRHPGDAEEEQRGNRLAEPGSIPGAAAANATGGDGQVDRRRNEHIDPGVPREAERVDRHALEDSPRAPEYDRKEHRGEPGSPDRGVAGVVVQPEDDRPDQQERDRADLD